MSKTPANNSVNSIIGSVRENRGFLNYYAIIMNGLEDVRRRRVAFTSAVHYGELSVLFEYYYNSINALYNILLVEYRGFAKAYMDLAVKAFRLWMEAVNPLAREEAGGEPSPATPQPEKKLMSSSDPREFLEELRFIASTPLLVSFKHGSRYHDPKAFIEFLEQHLDDAEKTLLEDVLGKPNSYINSFYVVLAILDKAVEEILRALHDAGVLARGKELVVGVVV